MGCVTFILKSGLLFAAVIGTSAYGQEATRMEPLTAESGKGVPQGTLCTQDKRWCLFISETGNVSVYDGQLPIRKIDGKRRPANVITNPAAVSMQATEAAESTLWPSLIRKPAYDNNGRVFGETIIYGVQSTNRAMYSGGNGSATWLVLSALSPHIDGSASGPSDFGFLVKIPLRASKMIRACFSEEDAKRRLGACHDEYSFEGMLTLGKAAKNQSKKSAKNRYDWPELFYQSRATATPGSSNFEKDNTRKQLKESDLIPRTDKKCSYARTYKYNGELGIYAPTKAEPECSTYLEP
jgi:hypothetical protein